MLWSSIFPAVLTLFFLISTLANAQCWKEQPFTLDDALSFERLGTCTYMHDSIAMAGIPNSHYFGQQNAGGVVVYALQEDGNWKSTQRIYPSKAFSPDLQFGYKLIFDQELALISTHTQRVFLDSASPIQRGSVIAYKNIDEKWVEGPELFGNLQRHHTRFGSSIAMNSNWVAIGAPDHDTTLDVSGGVISDCGVIFMYQRNSNNDLELAQTLIPNVPGYDYQLGRTLAISDSFLFSGLSRDFMDIYKLGEDEKWVYHSNIFSNTGDFFGSELHYYNGQLMVGAPNDNYDQRERLTETRRGSVRIFEYDEIRGWKKVQKLSPPEEGENHQFGASIDANNGTLVIGAFNSFADPAHETNGTKSGVVYQYAQDSSGQWIGIRIFKPSNLGSGDRFGQSVGTNGQQIMVGAPYKSHRNSDNLPVVQSGVVFFYNEFPPIDCLQRPCPFIYPNPASTTLDVFNYTGDLTIYDVYGHEVLKTSVTDNIDISYLRSGLYYVKYRHCTEALYKID